jgi:sec-independent protein translocase protein TatA
MKTGKWIKTWNSLQKLALKSTNASLSPLSLVDILQNLLTQNRGGLMGEFSLTHWIIILTIVLIFFGPSKLPGLGKSIGEAIRGFKQGLNEGSKENEAQERTEKPAQQISASEVKKEIRTEKSQVETHV